MEILVLPWGLENKWTEEDTVDISFFFSSFWLLFLFWVFICTAHILEVLFTRYVTVHAGNFGKFADAAWE